MGIYGKAMFKLNPKSWMVSLWGMGLVMGGRDEDDDGLGGGGVMVMMVDGGRGGDSAYKP